MKRMICLLLIWTFALSLMLSGCRASEAAPPAAETTDPSQTTEQLEFTQETDPEASIPVSDPGPAGTEIPLENTGKLRVSYSGSRSSVRYITSPDDLPDYPEFDAYDEAFFQSHALVLVEETVTSGSIQVSISGISVDGGSAVVTLSHETAGDMGTSDMATWLLWAEVESGLDCRWTVANPAVTSGAEKY